MRLTRPVLHGPRTDEGAGDNVAMMSVSAGYGIEVSRTPMIVADLSPKLPRRTAVPMTEGSFLESGRQKLEVKTTTATALGPSVAGH